jgi:hypothetical protein
MKASELEAIYKAQGFDDEAARDEVTKAVKAGDVEDDLLLLKGKASTMLDALIKGGMADDKARTMVTAQITAGTIEDDTDLIEADDLAKASTDAVDAIAKAQADMEAALDVDGDYLPDEDEDDLFDDGTDPGAQMDIYKGTVEAMANVADRVIKSSHAGTSALMKAVSASVQLSNRVLKATLATQAMHKANTDRMDRIEKALGIAVPPRAKFVGDVVPHPGEQGGGASQPSASKVESFIAKAQAAFDEEGVTNERRVQLASALGRARDGFDIDTLATETGLSL